MASQVSAAARDVEGEPGAGRNREEADRIGLAGVVGRFALLVVVPLMRRHDLDAQAPALDLWNHVPEGERSSDVVLAAGGGLATEQHIDRREGQGLTAHFDVEHILVVPAAGVPPLAAGQLLRCATHDAFDATPGQIRQSIGIEEGEAVLQWMLVAETGGEGRDGLGLQKQDIRLAHDTSHCALTRAQLLHASKMALVQLRYLSPSVPRSGGVLVPNSRQRIRAPLSERLNGVVHSAGIEHLLHFIPFAAPGPGTPPHLPFLIFAGRPYGKQQPET